MALFGLILLCTSVQAQFGFFEQMFGGGRDHEEPQQEASSDSSWYQRNYDGSMLIN